MVAKQAEKSKNCGKGNNEIYSGIFDNYYFTENCMAG